MTLVLLIALSAAPKAGTTLALSFKWDERLKVKVRGHLVDDNTLFDTQVKLRVDSVKDGRPDALTLEPAKKDLPVVTAKDDSGAPVLSFSKPPPLVTQQVFKRAFGRLVVPDPEREAMSSCTEATEAATSRWLQQAVARLNGSEPADVTLSDLKLTCKATKTGTKLDLSFSAKVPRAMLTITLQQKGTLTVDQAVWFTQWKISGPVHVTGNDVEVDGTFASTLAVK